MCCNTHIHDITFLCQSAKEHDEDEIERKKQNSANKSHHDAIVNATSKWSEFSSSSHTLTYILCQKLKKVDKNMQLEKHKI